jgi:hypothetical protein
MAWTLSRPPRASLSAPFRIESDNPREITGSLESDGSILLSGSMDIAPGVTISF